MPLGQPQAPDGQPRVQESSSPPTSHARPTASLAAPPPGRANSSRAQSRPRTPSRGPPLAGPAPRSLHRNPYPARGASWKRKPSREVDPAAPRVRSPRGGARRRPLRACSCPPSRQGGGSLPSPRGSTPGSARRGSRRIRPRGLNTSRAGGRLRTRASGRLSERARSTRATRGP